MARCKACGAKIVWVKTAVGRVMPCNPEKVLYWQTRSGGQRVVTPSGDVVSAVLYGLPGTHTGIGYISHFATCPGADTFRRRKKCRRS